MNNENKNGFFITWVSCIVVLLTLCFFGINDSIKGTHSFMVEQGQSCGEGYTRGDCITGANGKIMCSCIKNPSSNKPTNPENPGDSEETTCPSGTIKGQVASQCGEGADKYKLSDKGNDCWTYSCVINDDDATEPECTYSNQSNCELSTKKECILISGCYVPKTISGAGDNYQCWFYNGIYVWGNTGSYPTDDSYCRNQETVACPDGEHSSHPGNDWFCKMYKVGNGVCYYDCTNEEDGAVCSEQLNCDASKGQYPAMDSNGNCLCVCECEDGSCDEPTETKVKQCWICDGKYKWDYASNVASSCQSSLRTESNCSGNPPVYPGNPGSPIIPTDPDDEPSTPSSSSPSTGGCYKNKDTGIAKWFESDPDNNSGTDLYEKVANSECEHNITDNPATGQIAMFIVWIIGFASIGYSIYYLMKFSKSE